MTFQKRDGFIFWFRILACTTLVCATLACFGSFHVVTIDNLPILEDFLGYNCSSFTSAGQKLCKSTERRHYSLWSVQDEFTVKRLKRSQGLCASSISSSSQYGFNLTGDIQQLVGGDLGKCSEPSLIAAAFFSVLTTFLACLLVVWVTVLSDHHEELYYSLKVHLCLSAATMLCSIIVILVYVCAINPLRLNPTYCESQSFFDVCWQEQGPGFWLQVSTASLCFITLLSGLRARRKDILGYDTDSRQSVIKSKGDKTARCRDICGSIHFWIKLGRLAEFVLMLIGVIMAFTYISASVPPGSISRLPNTETVYISNRVNLWEGIYCSHNVLWWSYLAEEAVHSFGHCDDTEMFHVQFASLKVLVSSGLAMVFKRDAKKNPFFYLIGILMDFLSLIFISVAIGLFRAKIYPGREEIQPSYCETWTRYIGTECSIKLGVGFYCFCAVLVLTTTNFVVEFCIAEKDQTYGARSAWNTVFKRIKQRRFKSVLYKPQSERNASRPSVGELSEVDDHNGQQSFDVDLSAIIETADDDSNSVPGTTDQ